MQHCTLAGVCEKSKGNFDLFQEARVCVSVQRELTVSVVKMDSSWATERKVSESLGVPGAMIMKAHAMCASACVGLSKWVLQQDA